MFNQVGDTRRYGKDNYHWHYFVHFGAGNLIGCISLWGIRKQPCLKRYDQKGNIVRLWSAAFNKTHPQIQREKTLSNDRRMDLYS